MSKDDLKNKEASFRRAGELMEEAINAMIDEDLEPRSAYSGALVCLTSALITQAPDAEAAQELIMDSMKAGAKMAILIEEEMQGRTLH